MKVKYEKIIRLYALTEHRFLDEGRYETSIKSWLLPGSSTSEEDTGQKTAGSFSLSLVVCSGLNRWSRIINTASMADQKF